MRFPGFNIFTKLNSFVRLAAGLCDTTRIKLRSYVCVKCNNTSDSKMTSASVLKANCKFKDPSVLFNVNFQSRFLMFECVSTFICLRTENYQFLKTQTLKLEISEKKFGAINKRFRFKCSGILRVTKSVLLVKNRKKKF